MPYTHKKVGDKYVVYKSGKKVGSTEGTKTALNKYLAALHIADNPKKESIKESYMEMEDPTMQNKWEHPGCDDQIGAIYVVLKPNADSSHEDILHKTHAFGVHQFDPQSVQGVYSDEGEAAIVAESSLRDLHSHLSEIEEKKDTILERIVKQISKLQKEINRHMQSASDRPEESDAHHSLAEKKMNIIRNLRDKHKQVKSAKKELSNLKDK